MPPKRLLVPVDYSPQSEYVAAYAIEMARHMGSRVDILNVWETMPNAPPGLKVVTEDGPRLLAEVLRQEAEGQMKAFLAKLEFGEVEHGFLIESGEPVRAILQGAEAHHYDLIVMGTHGRTGVKHLVLGSVAERVVRGAKVPVLTVPLKQR